MNNAEAIQKRYDEWKKRKETNMQAIQKQYDMYMARKPLNIESFESDLAAFDQDMRANLNGWNDAQKMQQYSSQIAALTERAKGIQNYFAAYGEDTGNTQEELSVIMESLQNTIHNLNEIAKQHEAKSELYKSFNSKEKYDVFAKYYPKYAQMSKEEEAKALLELSERYSAANTNGTDDAAQLKEELDYLYNYGSEETKILGRKEQYRINQTEIERLKKEIDALGGAKQKNAAVEKVTQYALEKYGNAEAAEKAKKVKELTEQYEALVAENNRYTRGQKKIDDIYDEIYALKKNDDYAELSQAGESKIINGIFGDNKYDYINNIDGYTGKYSAGSLRGGRGGLLDIYSFMKDDEIEAYNYYYAKEGKDSAEAFLKKLQGVLDQRQRASSQGAIEGAIAKGGFEGVAIGTILNAMSIPTNIIGGVVSVLDNFSRQISGQEINPDSEWQSMRNFANDVRRATSEQIEQNTSLEFLGQNVMANLYNAFMSAADSVVGGKTMGSLYAVAMGSGAAANKSAELYEKGASNSQIFWGGLSAGIAEYVFEKIPLENLIKPKNPDSVFKVVWEILKQAGIEGFEEIGTEIANTITDSIIMGSQSDLSLAVKEYQEQGLSYEEAYKKALLDKAVDISWAGISGFLSGGMSLTASTGYQALKNITIGRSIKKIGGSSALIDFAKQNYGKDTEVYKLAEQLSKKQNVGEMALGALYTAIQQQNQSDFAKAEDVSAKAIQLKLENKGIKAPQAASMAKSIAKDIKGGTLTAKQRQAITENDAANSVYESVRAEVEHKKAEVQAKESALIDALSREESNMPNRAQNLDNPGQETYTENTGNINEKAAAEEAASFMPAGPVITERSAENPAADRIADTVYNMHGQKRMTGDQGVIKRIGARLGWTVEFGDVRTASGMPADGKIDKKNKVITISTANKNPIAFVLKHELAHFGEGSKQYAKLIKTIAQSEQYAKWLRAKTGENTTVERMEAALNTEIRQRYEAAGEMLSVAEARAEIMADFMGDMLFADAEGMNRLLSEFEAPERRSFIQWIKDALAYLKSKLGNADSRLKAELERLEQQYARMLRESGTDARIDNSDKYSLNPNFETQYEEWDKKRTDFSFFIGNTSDALKSIGIKDRAIRWDASKIVKIKAKHPYMTDAVIKQVPNILENPVLIMESQTNPDRITLFGEVYDAKENPVLAVLELNPTNRQGTSMDIIKIASAYGKDTNPQSLIDRSKILYKDADKKRIQSWLNLNRLQLPLDRTNFESKNRISHEFDSVNSNSMQKGEKNTEKASSGTKKSQSNNSDIIEAEDGVQYSIAKSYEQQVEDVLNNNYDKNNHVYMGKTPSKLVRILGLTDLPMLVTNNHIYSMSVSEQQAKQEGRYKKGTHYHDLGDIVKELPKLLNEPVLIIKSNTKADDMTVVVVTSAMDKSGRPIMAAIKPNGKGDYCNVEIDANIMLSGYGRNNMQNYVQTASNEGRILYADKKSNQQHNPEGVQFPNNIMTADYDNSLARYRQSVNSILFQKAENDTKETQYSIPTDYTQKYEEVTEQRRNGEITEEEYIRRIGELFTEAGKEYGTIPQGEEVTGEENFANPVPKSVKDGTKVRRHVRTILEGGKLTEEMVNTVKQQIVSGDVSYTPTSNAQSLKKAQRDIERGDAERIWENAVRDNRISDEAIAVGETLLALAVERKDAAAVVKLTAELAEVGTRTGQALQAMKLLKRMDGIGQLVFVQRAVQTLNRDLEKRFKKKFGTGKNDKGKDFRYNPITIDPALAEQLAESKTAEDFGVSYEAIMQDLAAQVPSTFLDKWNAWRYMAMLANPVTMVRNLVGNAIFVPAVRIKDVMAAGLEKVIIKDESQRTKALRVDKQYKDFAAKDFDEMADIVTGNGKYNPKRNIADQRKVFKTAALEGIRRGYGNVLEGTDKMFLKRHYISALSSFLQARKADTGSISPKLLSEARQYAIVEAQKATYRDASAVANAIQRFSNTNALTNLATEAILPFKKTPVNILKRGVEYSPVGLVKTLTKGIYDVRNGQITLSQFCDGLASGLTGTGIMAVGMLLSSLGVITVGFGGDDDEWFRKLNGEQEYAIQIGDVSYTLDWAAPACIPFFMGAAVMELFTAEDNNNSAANITDAFLSGMDVITELSMLSGINDVIKSVRYGEENGIVSILSNMAASYFSQALPSVGGKIANTIDDTRRINYVDKTSDIPGWLQSAMNTVKSKVPGLSQTRPAYINAWGEEEKSGSWMQRFFQNFISPGYLSTIEENRITDELTRLAKATGKESVLPDSAPKYFSFKGTRKNLTAEEYRVYATVRGQRATDSISEAIKSAGYRELTDMQKAEVIQKLYAYANAYAKASLVYSYEEIRMMNIVDITQAQYNRLSDKDKKALAKEYFLDGYEKVFLEEKNGGSAAEYYIRKEQENETKPEKQTKKKQGSEEIITAWKA